MTVLLTYDQLESIIRNLDLHSRIYMGQYDEILYRITGRILYYTADTTLHDVLCKLRNVFIPSMKGCGMNSSLGIWSDKTPMVAVRSYDIQQCLRYQLAYYKSGGKDQYTVNFRVPYIYGEWGLDSDAVNRNHMILEEQNLYPDFRKGYARRYVWACPCIITGFESDSVMVEWSDDVQKIIDVAEQTVRLVGEKKITDLFKLLYPTVHEDNFKQFTEYVEKYFRNRKGWSK